MIERRANTQTGKTTGFRARYTGPDSVRHSRTFTPKRDAEAWLAIEERLTARNEWHRPRLRAQPASVTVLEYAVKNLELRRLSPRRPRSTGPTCAGSSRGSRWERCRSRV